MSTTRAFAYNPPPNAVIAGTEQVGSLAVGTPTSGFTNNPQFWNGPDEELGYVIANPVSGGTQPNPLSIPAYLGFWRTDGFTEIDFIDLAEYVSQYDGSPQNFATGNDASTWLTSNGYWNSWVPVTPTPTPTNTVTPTITPTNISCLNIATNAGGGLDGFNVGGQAVGMTVLANPALGTTYPVGSFITFQNGEVRTISEVGDYGEVYDIIYSSPISSATLFPITICYPSIPTPTPTPTSTSTPTPSVTNTQTPTTTPTPTSTPTQGAAGNFNVTISQVGNDVVWSGSGSFNLAALTSDGPGSVGAGYASNQAIWAIGPGAPVDTYIGTITYPLTFGTNAVPVTSASGSTFGILPGGSGRLLYVPSGYITNTNISGTATYINTTIAGAGLIPGTYTWSWGTGGNTSTLVMTISS